MWADTNPKLGPSYDDNVLKMQEHQTGRNCVQEDDIISWTVMIVGYGQNGCSEEAVKAFSEMQSLEERAQFHCLALGKCGSIEEIV